MQCLVFNEACIKEGMLLKYAHTHTLYFTFQFQWAESIDLCCITGKSASRNRMN